MKKNYLSLLICLALYATPLQAQWLAGAGLQVGIPAGDFAKNTNAVGVGINVYALKALGPSLPIFVGIDGGYMMYGNTVNRLSQNITFLNTNIPLRYRVETTNNLINMHGVLRVAIPTSAVTIYLDGLVGFRYIYTRTTVKDDTPQRTVNVNSTTYTVNNQTLGSRTNLSDFIFSYGGGGGFIFNVGNFKIDTRVVYLLGSEANYLDRDAVQQAPPPQFTQSGTNINTSLEFDQFIKRSRTDMFFASVGIAFNF